MGKGKRLRADRQTRKAQEVPALEPGCRNGTGENPQLLTNLPSDAIGTLAVGVMCDWRDGQPLGTADFIDVVSDVGCDAEGLCFAEVQSAYVDEMVFVQGYCPSGENSACISVLHRVGQNDVSKRIMLPKKLERSDAIFVTMMHQGSFYLSAAELYATALSAIEQTLIEDGPIAERYSENRPCGVLYIRQGYTGMGNAVSSESNIMVGIHRATDELVKYVQLGWPPHKHLADMTPIY